MSSGAFIERFDLPPTSAGILDGLVFAAKDVIDIAGKLTGCGNPTWRATHPPAAANAVCVEILLSLGAHCAGKTITDELAYSLVGENHFYGTPLNPKAPDRVPGGSSSGSASAVASAEVDFALGTDTGGSARVPAANCGIFGFRPTHGRISTAGVQALAPSFDTVGVLARDPSVLERVAICLTQPALDPTPLETVFLLEDAWELADPEVQSTRSEAVALLTAAGLNVIPMRLRELTGDGEFADLLFWKQAYVSLQAPEIWSVFGGWIESAKPEFGPKSAENFALARSAGRPGLSAAIARRNFAASLLPNRLQPGSAIALPTSPAPAPLKGKVDYDRSGTGYVARALAYTSLAGIGGLPQISMPLPKASPPIGLSLIGGRDQDLALSAFARRFGTA